MELIHKKTLWQAIKMLDAIGCAYAIKDTDGNKHGTLELAQEAQPQKTRQLRFPFGEISAHVRKYLTDLGVGEVAYIPCDKYGNKSITQTATALMIEAYGRGSYKCAHNKAEDTVVVIRFN
jgi:hypothetical protein